MLFKKFKNLCKKQNQSSKQIKKMMSQTQLTTPYNSKKIKTQKSRLIIKQRAKEKISPTNVRANFC